MQKPKAAVAFIFITILLDMLALGLVIPVLPLLIRSYAGGTEQAAEIFGIFGTCWALMQFLGSPLIGSLSDRFGRRPIVLLSNIGLGLDYILMAMAPNLTWLFIGRIISGICAASISTSFAYIADITPGEKRAKAFGMMGAAFGVGFVLGPALGGMLSSFGPRTAFWVAAALSLSNALYGLFVLPESLSKENRAAFSWRNANPVGALKLLAQKTELLGFGAIHFLNQLAHVVYPSTFVLYTAYRYGWNSQMVGYVLCGVGVCSMVVQGGLVGPIIKRLGDRRTMLLGMSCGVVGFTLYGLADTPQMLLAAVPVGSLWGLANPAMQGLMTRLVAPSEQGRLQGANNSLSGIAQMVGPSIFTLSFSHAVASGVLVGLPFVLASAFVALACLVGLHTTTRPPQPAEAAAE